MITGTMYLENGGLPASLTVSGTNNVWTLPSAWSCGQHIYAGDLLIITFAARVTSTTGAACLGVAPLVNNPNGSDNGWTEVGSVVTDSASAQMACVWEKVATAADAGYLGTNAWPDTTHNFGPMAGGTAANPIAYGGMYFINVLTPGGMTSNASTTLIDYACPSGGCSFDTPSSFLANTTLTAQGTGSCPSSAVYTYCDGAGISYTPAQAGETIVYLSFGKAANYGWLCLTGVAMVERLDDLAENKGATTNVDGTLQCDFANAGAGAVTYQETSTIAASVATAHWAFVQGLISP